MAESAAYQIAFPKEQKTCLKVVILSWPNVSFQTTPPPSSVLIHGSLQISIMIPFEVTLEGGGNR